MRAIVRRLVIATLLGAAVPASAASVSDLLACSKAIHARGSLFVRAVQAALSSCATKVVSCQLAEEIDFVDPTQCLASASSMCGAIADKLADARAVAEAKALHSCLAIAPADLEQYVAGPGFFAVSSSCGATTVTQLLGCIFDATQCATERAVFALDPRSGDALAVAGIAAAHPCVGP